MTAKDGRAELHIGPNAIRLDSTSNFSFLNLDDNIVQVSLTEGAMEIHLRQLDDSDSFEIATPNGAITLLRTGDYRIDTDPDRDAMMLTVRAGQAELYSGTNASMIIRAGETAYVHENQDPDVRSANDPDDFDAFISSREGGSDAPAITSHLDPTITGAEDLSAYGSWQNIPSYGDVWVPPVDTDWAPYSDGDWSYMEPWGWTWIDSAPWGFAPFHYGRWIFSATIGCGFRIQIPPQWAMHLRWLLSMEEGPAASSAGTPSARANPTTRHGIRQQWELLVFPSNTP